MQLSGRTSCPVSVRLAHWHLGNKPRVGTRWEMAPATDGPSCPRAAGAGSSVLGKPPHSGPPLPFSTGPCPLTATVSLCSRKEHLWNDKPSFSREDGVDHPSDCGISLDLRVPHPSHCCASLLEVSEPGRTYRGDGGGG